MNSVIKTIKKVRHTISRYNMIRHGDRVIVAVSGGPDSVCLLDILCKLQDDLEMELVVAHFDHGLRPEDDEHETRFVESLADSFHLPFKTKKADASMGKETASLEENARHARYQFLGEMKEKFSARKIALGHNLNDQAETVLMRLLRGSGPSGLAGIPPHRDEKIIRPLIEVSRDEIETYIKQRGLNYVTDVSNLETRYLRNRIRLKLLPQLKKYQPRIVELLGQTAKIIREDDEWLEVQAKEWVEGAAETVSQKDIRIPLSSFRNLPRGLRNRVIRQAIKMTGGTLRRLSLRHIEAINRVVEGKKSQAQVDLPNRLTARRVYDKLIFAVASEGKQEGFCCYLDRPGTFRLEDLGWAISLEEMKEASLPEMGASKWTAFLNADQITYPLTVRNFRAGDRFVPFGTRGHKKLKDFFIDLKIPSEARARIPILVCQNSVIWVCGLRIDDRFKVTPETKNVLKVTFKGNHL